MTSTRPRAAAPRRRAAPVLLVLVGLLGALVGCTEDGPARDPAREQATAFVLEQDPAEVSRGIDRAFSRGGGDFEALRSVIVHQGGQLVVERYYLGGADASANTYSVTKSVLGALVGIAVADGDLALGQRLSDLLPRYADVMAPDVAALTLRQLLTMTAGLAPDEGVELGQFARSDDWVAEILEQGVTGTPGRFAYSSQTSHVLGAVLTEAVGTTLLDYADRRLFRPLGIDLRDAATPVVAPENLPEYDAARFAWPTDPSGLFTGFAFLKLRPVDLLRLGLLYLQGGEWEGRQVVPRRWVEQSTTNQLDELQPGDLGYGFHWWTTEVEGHEAFGALGAGGQLIEVVPDMELVVVATSVLGAGKTLDGAALAERVNRVVLPALEPA